MWLGQRSSTKESAESVASMVTLPTIAQTTNRFKSVISENKLDYLDFPAFLFVLKLKSLQASLRVKVQAYLIELFSILTDITSRYRSHFGRSLFSM